MAAQFEKFRILVDKDSLGQETEEVDLIINLDHIISFKPIRISRPDKLINGFWIRTTNGKKYKATHIPTSLSRLVDDKYLKPVVLNFENDDQTFQ